MSAYIELSIKCGCLQAINERSAIDPIVVAFGEDETEVGRTEYIVADSDPQFRQCITIAYNAEQEGDKQLTFIVYDVDTANELSDVLDESNSYGVFKTSAKKLLKNGTTVGCFNNGELDGEIVITSRRAASKISSAVPAPPPAPRPSRPEPSKDLLEAYQSILACKTLAETDSDIEAEFGDDITNLVEKIYSRRNMFDCTKIPDDPFVDSWEEKWSSKEPSRDKEGEQLVLQLIELLKASGQKFVDPHFPPCDASLLQDPSEGFKNEDVDQTFRKDEDPFLAGIIIKDIQWKRSDEICNPKSKPTVFSGTISPNDVAQGMLGNCYFLAALAGCAGGSSDVLIKDLIIEEGKDCGIYGVKFFVAGRWTTIIVDDLFPCTYKEGQWKPIFASPKEHRENMRGEKELWSLIFEKAWAKLHQSYESTDAGYSHDAANYLTAGITSVTLVGRNRWEAWTQMTELSCDDENLVFISTSVRSMAENKLKRLGLMDGHRYSVLAAKETSSGLKMIQVRNPWGSFEWKGDYSDKSPLWTPELRAELNAQNNEDGSFWMTWEDFARYFSNIEICDPRMFNKMYEDHIARVDGVTSQWVRNKTAGGGDKFETFQYNPHFELTVDGPEVWLTLFQPDTRSTGSASKEVLEYMDMSLYLIDEEEEEEPQVVISMPDERQLSKRIEVEAGKTYKLFAAAWAPGVEGSFTITACGHNCTLTPLPFEEPPADAALKMAKQDSRTPVCFACGKELDLWKALIVSRGLLHKKARCVDKYNDEFPGENAELES